MGPRPGCQSVIEVGAESFVYWGTDQYFNSLLVHSRYLQRTLHVIIVVILCHICMHEQFFFFSILHHS